MFFSSKIPPVGLAGGSGKGPVEDPAVLGGRDRSDSLYPRRLRRISIIFNPYFLANLWSAPSWQNRLIVCQISMIVKIGDDCGSTLLCKDLLRIEKVSRLGFSEFRNRQRGNSISDWER